MFSSDVLMMFAEGIRDTLYMTLVSTAFAYLLGLPIAILLVVTRKNGLHPMPALFGIFDFVVNILRSVPFLILMLAIGDFFLMITSSMYGISAALRLGKTGEISKTASVIYFMLHFFFVADMISAILLYRSAKKGKKHIS